MIRMNIVQPMPVATGAARTLQAAVARKLAENKLFEMHLYAAVAPVCAYDVKEGLLQNDCVGNLCALATALAANDKETARKISYVIKRTCSLDQVLSAWDSLVTPPVVTLKSALLALQICNYVGQSWRNVFMAPGFPVNLLLKLLRLFMVTCFGEYRQHANMQAFSRDLSAALASKRGPELTEYLLRQPAERLVNAVKYFSRLENLVFARETLDILTVTKTQEFRTALFEMPMEKRTNFNEVVLVLGHTACANLILDAPVKEPAEVTAVVQARITLPTEIVPFGVFEPVSDFPLPPFIQFVEAELDAAIVVPTPVIVQPDPVSVVEEAGLLETVEKKRPSSSKRRANTELSEMTLRSNRAKLSDGSKYSQGSA